MRDDEIPKHRPKKKDTKRWCGGHVGREHTPKCMTYFESKGETRPYMKFSKRWRLLVCTTCGKELDHWYPIGKHKEKPSWVT